MAHPTLDSIAEMIRTAEARGEKFQSNRSVVSPKAIAALRAERPGIPEDYLGFLGRIGAGSLLSSSYAIYDGLIEPDEIFGLRDDSWPPDLIAFGDNFSGDLGVFIPSSDWAVAELWHDDRSIVRSDGSFLDFIGGVVENLTKDE